MSTLKAEPDGRIALQGALTSREVAGLYRQSLAWHSAGLPGLIDLEGVEQADSSALALLLEWRSWAIEADHELRIINVPRSLCVMASLSQIEGLLGWRTLDFNSGNEDGQCCA